MSDIHLTIQKKILKGYRGSIFLHSFCAGKFESLLNPKRLLFWTIPGQAIALCLCGGPGKVHMASAAFGVASSSFHLPRGFFIPRPVGKQICFVAVSSVPELWRKGPRTVGWSSAFSNILQQLRWGSQRGKGNFFNVYQKLQQVLQVLGNEGGVN